MSNNLSPEIEQAIDNLRLAIANYLQTATQTNAQASPPVVIPLEPSPPNSPDAGVGDSYRYQAVPPPTEPTLTTPVYTPPPVSENPIPSPDFLVPEISPTTTPPSPSSTPVYTPPSVDPLPPEPSLDSTSAYPPTDTLAPSSSIAPPPENNLPSTSPSDSSSLPNFSKARNLLGNVLEKNWNKKS